MISTKKIIKEFRAGLNCAQSVILVFTDQIDLDKKTALSITCGFGAGMGKLQQTCGAVTGAYMVISYYNSLKFQKNEERNETASKMIQEFNTKFIDKHRTTCCKELLNCDLNTDEGKKFAENNKLFETVCEKCIISSIQILKKMLNPGSSV